MKPILTLLLVFLAGAVNCNKRDTAQNVPTEDKRVVVSDQFRLAALRAVKAINLIDAGPAVEQSRVRGLVEEADVQRRNAADDAVWELLDKYRTWASLIEAEFRLAYTKAITDNSLLSVTRMDEARMRARAGPVTVAKIEASAMYKAAEICRQEIESSLRHGSVKPDSRCLKFNWEGVQQP